MDSAAGTTRYCRFVARSVVALLALALSVPVAGQDYQMRVEPLGEVLPGTPLAMPVPPSPVWWTIPIAAPPGAAPLLDESRVYVAWLPGTVSAHDLDSGTEVWRTEIAAEHPMAMSDGLLYLASGEALHAVRIADGTLAWRAPVGTLTAPPVAKDGWVIVSTADALTALRARDGSRVWTQPSGPHRHRAAINGDLLITPLADGRLEARQITTGVRKWICRLGGAPTEPLVLGNRVYLGASDQYFYAIAAGDGRIDWRRRVGAAFRGRPVSDGERVLFAALDNIIRAVDRDSGSLRWQEHLGFRPFGEPGVAGEVALVTGPGPSLRVLNAETGQRFTVIPFPQELAVTPAVMDRKGSLVVAAVTGSLEEAWNLTVASIPSRVKPPPIEPKLQ